MPHNADLIRMRPAQPVAQNGQWPPRQARFWLKMSPELPFTLFFTVIFLLWLTFVPHRSLLSINRETMDQKQPTIKEIAQRLNISVSTVSRALHNHPRIGLRTKMQVQKLAQELNYEPNTLAISFKQKKWYTIGVILPELSEQFFSQAISGIEDVATQQGYNVLLGQSHDSVERERVLVETFRKHRVDGMIISVSKHTDDYLHLEALDKYNIPLVYFDRIPKGGHPQSVSSNIRSGAELAVDYLVEKGHKKIALLKGPASLMASEQRQDGYNNALKRHGIKIDASLIREIDLSLPGPKKPFRPCWP